MGGHGVIQIPVRSSVGVDVGNRPRSASRTV
jgi:hypothetical protein